MESIGNSTSVKPSQAPVLIESAGAVGINSGGGPAMSQQVIDNGTKSDVRIAIIFAVSAVVVSLVLMLFCYGLWNRYDLLKINYNDLKAAMLLHGINPHPHFPAESP